MTRASGPSAPVPKVRDGTYFPSMLEPRRRAARALLAVVQDAYVLGVSTRRVEDLVATLDMSGLSKSEVSREVVNAGRGQRSVYWIRAQPRR